MAADISCAEFAIRLEARLDDAALKHLSACVGCRRRKEAFDVEEGTLRRALRPVANSEVPPGLEARVLAALPRWRRSRRPRIVLAALAAAAAVVAVVALVRRESESPSTSHDPSRVSPVVASPIRFDADTRRLSLADGSEMRLSPGSDAEFEAVAGTRGQLLLRRGEVFAFAAPGDAPLLLEAPGLRARTNDARFLAATADPGSPDGSPGAHPAAVYVLAGHVSVEDGAPPVHALSSRPNCPRDDRAARISCRSCHQPAGGGSLSLEFAELILPGSRDDRAGAEAEEAEKGAVEGRVLDAHGNVVASAFVRLRRPGERPIAVKTDDEGRFAFREVEAGDYEVAATAQGYLDGSETARVLAGETSVFPVIALREERRLSGRVVDRAGAPVAGARVHARPVRAADPSHVRGVPVTHFPAPIDGLLGFEADARRAAAVTQLRIGSMEKLLLDVRTAANGGVSSAAIGSAEFHPDVRLEAKAFDIQLQTKLRLTWSTENTLVVSDLSGGRGTEADADGRFEITGLGDEEYTVSASFPDWIQVGEPPSVLGGVTGLELVLSPGGEIRGTVYGPDGLPRAGARVNDAVTDSEGRYRITGLSTGLVDLFAGAAGPNRIVIMRYEGKGPIAVPELSSVQLDSETRHGIMIRNGQITVTPDATPDSDRPGIAIRREVAVSEGAVTDGVDFHLPPARVVDGFVHADDGSTVAGAVVEFRAGEEIPYFSANRRATTDENGFFRLDGVFDVAGAMIATASDHFESEAIDAGPEAAVTGLRLTLPRAASIRGEIAAEATLTLVPLDVADASAIQHRIAPESEESSAFRVGDLRPGRYAARAESDAGEATELGVVVLRPGEATEIGDLSPALGLR